MTDKKPTVSVVIPAFNEEKYIEDTLFSLLKSEQKTNLSYEVILIDNNSTDQTVKRALKFNTGISLRIIQEKRQGRGAARARGFKEAKGRIILSADADTIFYSGWVEELSSAIKDDVVAVSTSCRIVDLSGFSNIIFNFSQPIFTYLYRIFLGHFWLAGFSFGITKEIYEKSGGFDPSLQAQEDLDLSFRVARLGKIKFINHPVIFSGRRFKKGLLIGLWDYIQSFADAFVFKKKTVYLENLR